MLKYTTLGDIVVFAFETKLLKSLLEVQSLFSVTIYEQNTL